MISKHIFLDQSIETEVTDIVNEILTYIDNQHKGRMISPDFYSEILLFLSEILPYLKNQDKWIDLGYMICKELKHNLENYGYNHRVAMFGGLGFQCFAVDTFCKQANILKNFSYSLNKLLFDALDSKIKQIKYDETYDSNYDMISGISGNLYYLLDSDYTSDQKDILIKCIECLLEFTKDTEYCGQTIIKFHIQQSNQNPLFDQEDFINGSINFGLAHGMLGPLIALAKAYSKGFIVDGLQEGIEKVFHLYEIFQVVNKENIPQWPGKITVEEYVEGTCKPEHLHTASSWCYGNVGIIRGLQKVAGYMNWNEMEQAYIEMMKLVYTQEIKHFNLFRPSICHGFSSLVAIQTCAYSVYKDPGLLTHLERNVRHIIAEYRKSNELELSLMDIRDKTNTVEGYLKDLSLLTGSTGIAITLLSLNGNIRTGRLLMID